MLSIIESLLFFDGRLRKAPLPPSVLISKPIKLSNSFVASIANAPAPSPKRIQLLLSFQSTKLDN
jgi:hypothetical protein